MNAFERETDRIYRLKVPFEELYTSVFLIESERGAILMDCATTAEDVDSCILPALKQMGYAPSDIWAIVLSHRHSDHAGGLARLLEYAKTNAFLIWEIAREGADKIAASV